MNKMKRHCEFHFEHDRSIDTEIEMKDINVKNPKESTHKINNEQEQEKKKRQQQK